MDLPDKIYVAWEDDNEALYLIAAPEVEELAYDNDKRKVGIYRLEELKTIVNKTEIVPADS